MAQISRLYGPFQDRSGNVFVGASVTVCREGATVNGAQSGTSPLAVTVRNAGKIQTGDTVFLNAASGTTYSATRTSETVITLASFAGTLVLANGDRIVPLNNLPTLYSDDQSGATTANPATTDANGDPNVNLDNGVYDVLLSGSGNLVPVPRLFPAVPVVGEATHSFDIISGARLVDGRAYPLTVVGIQTALDEVAAISGGTVHVPSAANIPIVTTSVKIPNRCAIWGTTSVPSGGSTFSCSAATNVTAVLENKTQDGTQQMAACKNIYIDGNKSSGAIVGAGVKFASIYVGTYIENCRVINCSTNGVLLNGASASSGPYYVKDLTVSGCGGDNILVQHTFTGLQMNTIISESPGTGKVCLRLQSDPSSAGRVIFGALLQNIYVENASLDATSYGIVLDGTIASTIINFGATTVGAANFGALLRIQKTGTVSPLDNRVLNLWQSGTQTPLIDDNYSGITITNANSSNVGFYQSPITGTDAPGYIYGVQMQRLGKAITAATTISPKIGNYFVINGNTNIDNITNSPAFAGMVLYLQTTGTPTLNHATGNLRLLNSANVAMTANDFIQMISDGTLWWQCAPVVTI